MKKFFALLVSLAALITLAFVATPAQAYPVETKVVRTETLTCSYDGNAAAVAGRLTMLARDDGRWQARMAVTSDNKNRTWDWRLFHQGDVSDSGTQTGEWVINQTTVDLNGEDTWRFNLRNEARTVACNASISLSPDAFSYF